jgi:hypothetical protein
MTIQKIGGSWYSTEATLVDALGYGDYIFTTLGRLDLLDVHAVLGLFLWQYGACYDAAYLWWNPYNEMDVEFSRWGDPGNDIGQFVAQPYDYPGNISRFNTAFSESELTSHAFRWLPDRVEFRSWRGGPEDEATGETIHAWTYAGPHIPRPEQPRVHINLWQFNGAPATRQEVVLDRFTFVPEGSAGAVPVDGGAPEAGHILSAAPNPFGANASIAFRMTKGGQAEVTVYDVLGRRVRALLGGFVQAGDHSVIWDGCDDSGEEVAPGAYLFQLRTDGAAETRKLVLLK